VLRLPRQLRLLPSSCTEEERWQGRMAGGGAQCVLHARSSGWQAERGIFCCVGVPPG
jgi:hypothetical protein